MKNEPTRIKDDGAAIDNTKLNVRNAVKAAKNVNPSSCSASVSCELFDLGLSRAFQHTLVRTSTSYIIEHAHAAGNSGGFVVGKHVRKSEL